MGLLTCRRPKKIEESTATSDDAPNPATQLATPGPIQAEIPSSEQAHVPDLQSLFQPTPSPLEQPRPIISLDGLSSNQGASSSAKVIRSRERRRPLEVFSGRIRRGLSRESKFPSRLSRRQDKHRIRSLFLAVESTAASSSFAQEHSLGSGLVSDRAYDSDAQYISTPKGSSQLAESGSAGKSSKKSPKSLPDVLEAALDEPSELSHTERIEECDTLFNSHGSENVSLNNTGSNRLESSSPTTDLRSSQEASVLRTSVNEASLQELTKLVGNKPSTALRTADGATSEASYEKARYANSSLEASERREIQSSTHMKPGRDAVRSDGNTEFRISRSVTCPMALTGSLNSPSEIHLCDMNISKRLAPSSVTPVGLSQDQSSGSNQRIAHWSNFGSAVSHGHEDFEAVALGFGSTRLMQTNNRGRDASSVPSTLKIVLLYQREEGRGEGVAVMLLFTLSSYLSLGSRTLRTQKRLLLESIALYQKLILHKANSQNNSKPAVQPYLMFFSFSLTETLILPDLAVLAWDGCLAAEGLVMDTPSCPTVRMRAPRCKRDQTSQKPLQVYQVQVAEAGACPQGKIKLHLPQEIQRLLATDAAFPVEPGS
ncbi:hypothetical protein VTN00DRAFT_1333 [Thermoascus crustaceus]|uniref:uncharacterized protein n=1 Tax=Thermoascus crustaceus TaxID=5088 RepID=UPI0037436A05